MLLNRSFLALNRLHPSITATNHNRLIYTNFKKFATSTSAGASPPQQKHTQHTGDSLEDGPIKFTTSQASRWHAKTSRLGQDNNRLWYEPHVIIISLSVFMLYFTVIRDENDVDNELSRSLYSRIEGLEEHQLRTTLEYNLQNNIETQSIIDRLRELEASKVHN